MKQHITVDQLNELNDVGKEKLYNWWHKGDFYSGIDILIGDDQRIKNRINEIPLLSIGQMIEFLDDKGKGCIVVTNALNEWLNGMKTWRAGTGTSNDEMAKTMHDSEELCDALWEAVKEVLNETN